MLYGHGAFRLLTEIPHASKTMLKVLQARLQQYVNLELPGVQAGFRKDRDITLPQKSV